MGFGQDFAGLRLPGLGGVGRVGWGGGALPLCRPSSSSSKSSCFDTQNLDKNLSHHQHVNHQHHHPHHHHHHHNHQYHDRCYNHGFSFMFRFTTSLKQLSPTLVSLRRLADAKNKKKFVKKEAGCRTHLRKVKNLALRPVSSCLDTKPW